MVTRLTGKKKKLSEFIIEEIKQQLKDGQLAEGDKLPNQNEFAQQLGVSRLSLREALNTLDQMGVIEQKTGVGTVIIAGNPDLWGEKPEAPLLADSKATLELLEARRSLETIISALSVKRIEHIELAALKKEIATMQEAIAAKDYETYLKADISFHYQLVKGAHNRYLLHMFLDIRNLMEKFMKESFYKQPSMMEISYQHHLNILDSIEARDPVAARKSITGHIEEIENLVENYYREHGQL